jgi:hypothetical protein
MCETYVRLCIVQEETQPPKVLGAGVTVTDRLKQNGFSLFLQLLPIAGITSPKPTAAFTILAPTDEVRTHYHHQQEQQQQQQQQQAWRILPVTQHAHVVCHRRHRVAAAPCQLPAHALPSQPFMALDASSGWRQHSSSMGVCWICEGLQ